MFSLMLPTPDFYPAPFVVRGEGLSGVFEHRERMAVNILPLSSPTENLLLNVIKSKDRPASSAIGSAGDRLGRWNS